MNHGLLAPQFGLVGRTLQDQDEGFHPPARAVPTVIVKRRRVPLEGREAPAVQADGTTPAVKTPKVYRLDTPKAEAPPPAPAVAEEVPAMPAAAPRRRRKDTLRAPTLVQHVVFERPPAEDPAAALLPLDDAAMAEYRAVRDALDRVRGELKKARQARRELADL